MSAPVNEVSPHAAYAAAEERAVRTTKALILAEAQVLTLTARVRELEERVSHFERSEEVQHDAASESDEADAGGAAHTAHPFSD